MTEFRVDSYKFLPRAIWSHFKELPEQPGGMVKAAAGVPLGEAKVALLTSAGLYLKDRQPPFDSERERREPLWGDPTYRVIPRGTRSDELGCSHLHINSDDILADVNVALPLDVFSEIEAEGKIGSLAESNYSFMGYQGNSCVAWEETYGPELAARLHSDGVNLLILAPS